MARCQATSFPRSRKGRQRVGAPTGNELWSTRPAVPRPQPMPSYTPESPRVCFVTAECIGAFRNGGIGTAISGLVELLAGHGLPVTLIYTGRFDSLEATETKQLYAEIGVAFETLQGDAGLTGAVAAHLRPKPWLVWRQVSGRDFDIIHFNDAGGEGALCIAAKAAGLDFQRTLLCVGTHGPTRWAMELNREAPHWPGHALVNADEELQFRFADVVWGPSKYILDWLSDNMALGPRPPMLRPNVLPTSQLFHPDAAKFEVRKGSLALRSIEEIVFFGRLEERKGLRIFLQAIDSLKEELSSRSVAVTFLGRFPGVDSGNLAELLRRESETWPFRWKMIETFDQREAVDYLSTGTRLAVIASPCDNSPCTVGEAIVHGIPFIASNGGGIPELLADSDRERVLFAPTPVALAAKIRTALDVGIAPARPTIQVDAIRERWLAFHRDWRDQLPSVPEQDSLPARVRVLIDHHGRAEGLDLTATSVARVLGQQLAETIILARSSAEAASISPIASKTYRDDAGAVLRLLSDLAAPGAALVLAIRSGVELQRDASAILRRPLPDDVDAAMPACRLGSEALTILPFSSAPAFRYFERHADVGGLITSPAAVAKFMHDALRLATLPYCGLLDLAVARGRILPLPIAAFASDAAALAPRPDRYSPERVELFGKVVAYDRDVILSTATRLFDGRNTGTRSTKALDLHPVALDHGITHSGAVVTNKRSRRPKSWPKRLAKFLRKRFQGMLSRLRRWRS